MTHRAIAIDPIPTVRDPRTLEIDEGSMRVFELCLAGLAIAVAIAVALLR